MNFPFQVCKSTNTDGTIELFKSDFSGITDDSKIKLSTVRNVLVVKGFIPADETTSKFRFVFPEVENTKDLAYSDRIVGKQSENSISAEDMLIGNSSQISITDTAKKTKPDLMGFETDWWTGGQLRVRAYLKNRDEESQKSNVGKFQPILLTNVVPTNESIQLHYSNVCICCEDSVIEFGLRCYGTVGFEYKATLASGDVIRQSAVHWNPYDKNLIGETVIDAWHKNGKDYNIVMKEIRSVSDIDPATRVQYQKITFVARDMLAWKDGNANIEYTANSEDPNKPKPSISFAKNAAETASRQGIIGGDDITPSTPTRGGETKVNYGNWWVTQTKPWEEPQGVLDVYFFNFTSLEAAKKCIDRFNMLKPGEQARIWA